MLFYQKTYTPNKSANNVKLGTHRPPTLTGGGKKLYDIKANT